MKRFIDLTNQIVDCEEGEQEFAFYCTTQGKFETIFGSQTWATVEEFIKDLELTEIEYDKDRLLSLIPTRFK